MKAKPCHCCGGTGKENDQVLIGGRLKSRRHYCGLQQLYVAMKLGITAQYLSDLEHGRRRWTQDMIDKYEAVLEQ